MDEQKLKAVLTDLKKQFNSDNEPENVKNYDEFYNELLDNARQRKALCLFIGQAHLLPNMNWTRLKNTLAEMGVDDWNNCGLPTLENVVEQLQMTSDTEL